MANFLHIKKNLLRHKLNFSYPTVPYGQHPSLKQKLIPSFSIPSHLLDPHAYEAQEPTIISMVRALEY